MSQQSLPIRLLFALAGHSRNGLRLKDIAQGVRESSPTTLRALQRLADDGVVERVEHIEGHWRLTPRIVQIALQHADEIAREDRISGDFKNRFSRRPD
ncbi:MAG: hypothetical protein JSS44_08955 [Proteobacteria bacterium]|nr:hypothetical protein [Pseudomonadota bacterium]MBS0501728.1 hypothetical protein [Pseudomonadota bacterium]